MRSIALKITTIAILPLLFASLIGCGPDTSETKPEDTNKQSCTPNPCQNGGTCQVNNGNAVCTCLNGYTGDHCETAPTQTVDPCASNPCQNGGTCSDVDGHFKCSCPDTHHGRKCQFDVIPGPFVFEIEATNDFSREFTISSHKDSEYNNNFNVDCDSDGTFEANNIQDNYTCTYPATGKYTITLTGDYPAIYLRGDSANSVTSVKKWGGQRWKSMTYMFSNNKLFESIEDPNPPILDDVSDFSYMFHSTDKFNVDISHWDVFNAQNMRCMFECAWSFNKDLSKWDISNVKNMSGMFSKAISFNADISNWDTSSVTDMTGMFEDARTFNGDISKWNTSNVTNMNSMFREAGDFNQDLSNWDVSNVLDCKHFTFDPPTTWPLSKHPQFTNCTY